MVMVSPHSNRTLTKTREKEKEHVVTHRSPVYDIPTTGINRKVLGSVPYSPVQHSGSQS